MVKFILGCLCVVLFFIAWCCGRIVIYNDYSTMPVSVLSNPDLGRKNYQSRPGVYLVSYADGDDIFFQNQQALAASALNRGIDFIFNYRKSHLDPDFVHQNNDILSQKIGAGFWVWKPWIILETLKRVPDGSMVVYADSGLAFDDSLVPTLEKMGTKDILLAQYDPRIDGYPIEIAKRDIFTRLNCDTEKCWNGDHVWAAFLIVRNTPKSRAFINRWLTLCSDAQLVTNSPSKTPPHARQKKNHHDEAILSVLYNSLSQNDKENVTLLPVNELRKFTFWHHRHRGQELSSILYKSSYFTMRGIERDWVLNAPWMKEIRRFLRS